tara:strand:+ start:3604 stop:4089 length:486 start_codon:yes stop_codon:yes gene_type:complete
MKNKAVFLDRDGVINKKRIDHVKSVDEFKIFSNVGDAIKLLRDKGYLVIIITNQSVIGRNIISEKKLDEIHIELKNYLKQSNTYVDSIYYCPHIPEQNCDCRKPKPGLLIKAGNDFGIDLEKSYFIGDSVSDLNAAKEAKCKGILLKNDQTLLEIVQKQFN